MSVEAQNHKLEAHTGRRDFPVEVGVCQGSALCLFFVCISS